MDREIRSYLQWRDGLSLPAGEIIETAIVQEKASELRIADADSDVLFESEQRALSINEYQTLKELALKSAQDFQRLFDAIPDKNRTILSTRETFYGQVPITAQQMYDHTSGVNSYYFGEIGLRADSAVEDGGNSTADSATNGTTNAANNIAGNIVTCRRQAFEQLERTQTGAQHYLANRLFNGSYGEEWTLRKVCRRFIWHDRIHAKAMYRMACKTFGAEVVPNILMLP